MRTIGIGLDHHGAFVGRRVHFQPVAEHLLMDTLDMVLGDVEALPVDPTRPGTLAHVGVVQPEDCGRSARRGVIGRHQADAKLVAHPVHHRVRVGHAGPARQMGHRCTALSHQARQLVVSDVPDLLDSGANEAPRFAEMVLRSSHVGFPVVVQRPQPYAKSAASL